MDFKKSLDQAFAESKENTGVPPENKFQFIGDCIFGFTTYDGSMDEMLAKRMLQVIEAILHQKTFEYIKQPGTYENFLIMINMPFLQGKLDWGGSIRGAWFDEYGFGNNKEEPYYMGTIECPKIQVKAFFRQLLEWSEE